MDLEYGRGSLEMPVIDHRLLAVLQPKDVRGIDDVEEGVKESLEKPVGTPPLASILEGKKKAVILTVNFSRPSPKALIRPIAALCDRMKLDVTILIARGRHRPMSNEEIRTHLGNDLVTRYPVLEHDPFDEQNCGDVGRTTRGVPIRVNKTIFENDVVIGTGIIEPSYLCGFSGGRKLLLPGIAHFRSIDLNHYLLLEEGARIGALDGNPLSEDSEEAARKLPFHWITYAVVGADDQVAEVISGDPFQAHRLGCEKSRKIYTCKKVPGDIVISSPGGYPYDCDLVQGKKAIIPAMETVKPKGTILVVAECEEGWGAESTFREWLMDFSPEEVMKRVMDRSLFSLGAHGAYLFAKALIEKEARVILVTNPDLARDLNGTYIEGVSSMDEALAKAEHYTGQNAKITVLRKARRLIIS
ncbi:MAG: nickel-dependent lactate racemase [Proteobacteria bacterium]|nr:nickel-dependent lactate racemase [Pseudomonadota bacterium]